MSFNLDQTVEGCKRGDRASQKALYYRYFNLFMTMAARYLPEKADAEEVLNNAFLKIFRHVNQYKGDGSFEGWMKKVLVNSCLAFVRTSGYNNRTKIVSLAPASDNDAAIPVDVSTEPGVLEKYDKEHLLHLISMLPETTRLVFNLYVFEDYNHKEIADELDIAERTSQAHLSKARQILSEELDKNKLINKIQCV